jgi:hypothetical protein
VSYDVEPYGSGNLSPAQLHATMDPLERMVTEADNNVATVVHERFGTERKLRETAEKFRVADEAWSRAVKSVRKRCKNQGPSAEDHHELMQLGATRRSLEWQLEQYRTRHAELVEIERDLAMHQLDLQVAAEEMRVNVDTLRSQQVFSTPRRRWCRCSRRCVACPPRSPTPGASARTRSTGDGPTFTWRGLGAGASTGRP